MEQNIISVSWNLEEFARETQEMIKNLEAFIDKGSKVGQIKPQLNTSNSASELRKQVTELQTLISQIEKKNKLLEREIQLMDQSSRKVKEVSKATTDATKSEIEAEKVKQEKLKTAKQQLSYEESLAKQRKRSQSDAEAEAKLAAQATNDYYQLGKALKDAEDRYKALALSQGFESEAAQEALQNALEIRGVLDKLDGNLRNYQRNVGNYKSAFDGLGVSFSQVARELPSLAVSAQTFILAISNNLPMVFDEITKARTEIAAMRAEGKETPSLISRIGSSFLSLNVVLSVAIGLFTIFGPKIIESVSGLFGVSNAADKAKDAIARYHKALLDLINTQETINDLLKDSILDSDRLQKELDVLKSLNKSRGDQLELERKIIAQRQKENDKQLERNAASDGFTNDFFGFQTLEKRKNDFEKIADRVKSLKKSLADGVDFTGTPFGLQNGEINQDARQKAFDNIQKDLDRAQISYDYYEKLYVDQKKLVKDRFDYQSLYDQKQNEIDEYNREEKLKKETEAAKIEAQINIDKNERILADDRKFEKERDAALVDRAESQRKIIRADYRTIAEDPANKNNDGTETAALINARKKRDADLNEVDLKLLDDRYKNYIEFRNRRLAAELELYKAQTEYAAASYKQIAESETKSFDQRMNAYADFYQAEQELLLKDYEYQKTIKVRTTEEALALDAEYLRKQKELAERARKETSDLIVSDLTRGVTTQNLDANLELSREELRLYKSLQKKAEFEKQKADLEKKNQKESLERELAKDYQIYFSNKTTAEAKLAALDRIKAKEAEYNKISLDEEQKKEAKKRETIERNYQYETLAVETFFSLAEKLSDRYYQKRFDQINKERKLLDDRYTSEVENIKNSTLSEQEKAAKITVLTAQQEAEKQRMANRERQEKIKQARTDKAINIAKIITETALAVVHQLTTGDPYTATARALLAGATGAAQLAVAVATPIPTYGDGTKEGGHKGGPAIIGERWKPELVEEPGKRPYIVDKPTLFDYLPKHTRITPLSVDDAMQGSMIYNLNERRAQAEYAEDIKRVRGAVLSSGSAIVKAIRKTNRPVPVRDNSYFNAYIDRVIKGR